MRVSLRQLRPESLMLTCRDASCELLLLLPPCRSDEERGRMASCGACAKLTMLLRPPRDGGAHSGGGITATELDEGLLWSSDISGRSSIEFRRRNWKAAVRSPVPAPVGGREKAPAPASP